MTNLFTRGRRKQVVDVSVACDFKDAFEGRRRQVFQRSIDAFYKGNRSGFAEGLKGAPPAHNINEEAGKKLLARHRDRDKSPDTQQISVKADLTK